MRKPSGKGNVPLTNNNAATNYMSDGCSDPVRTGPNDNIKSDARFAGAEIAGSMGCSNYPNPYGPSASPSRYLSGGVKRRGSEDYNED